LRKIILAGTKAPSGGNKPALEFIVIEIKDNRTNLERSSTGLNRTLSPTLERIKKPSKTGPLFQKIVRECPICCRLLRRGTASSDGFCIETCPWPRCRGSLEPGSFLIGARQEKRQSKFWRLPKNYELVCVLKNWRPGEVRVTKNAARVELASTETSSKIQSPIIGVRAFPLPSRKKVRAGEHLEFPLCKGMID